VVAFAPSPVPLVIAGEHLAGRAPQHDKSLVRVRPGVYAPIADWSRLAPWERYLARVHATKVRIRDPVFCLESAAALLGLPLFGEPRHIHLLARGARTVTRGDVVAHAFLDSRAAVSLRDTSATSVADTVLDLGRVLPPAFGLAVADAALHHGEVSVESLRGRFAVQRARRGSRQIAWMLSEADPLAESVTESISRAVIGWLGYERPELQVKFRYEGVDDRVDFYWRRRRTIGEADGFGKYDAGDTESSKARFIAEKVREDRLRRYERGFVRWDSHDPFHPQRLDAKLRAAGLIPERAPNVALLATLRQASRRSTPASARDG
jgi:hypothetical protein